MEWDKVKARVQEYAALYRTSPEFRTRISLYRALFINAVYALFKAACGFYYHSWWFGTFAFYYIIMGLDRFFLVKSFKSPLSLSEEYRKARRSGILLLVLTPGLVGMSVLITHDGFSFSYNTAVLYAIAAYAFYNISSAVVNVIKYKRYKSPRLSACRTVILINALVSMYSLQTAMLEKYGSDPAYTLELNAITGSALCLITLVTSIGTIVSSSVKRRKLNKEAK